MANDTACFLGVHPTVSGYVKRYNRGGIEALARDKTRKPGKAAVTGDEKNRICKAACTEKPEDARHWNTWELAERFGISHNAASLVLRWRGDKSAFSKAV
jgi:transposase